MPTTTPELEPRLAAALSRLAEELAPCADPWWLIGSAAMALHGAPGLDVRDIDLLLSRRDAEALLARRGIAALPGRPDALFRSDIFARWNAGGIAVEMFAGFHLRSGGAWQPLRPQTREKLTVAGACLFVPSVAELIAWCRLFGRPKDAAREELLRSLLP